MNVSLDSVCRSAGRQIEIVCSLEIHPELWRHVEVARETQGRVTCDAATTIHDLAHPGDRHAQIAGESIDANPSGTIRSSRRISPGCTGGRRRLSPSFPPTLGLWNVEPRQRSPTAPADSLKKAPGVRQPF